jgi:hypothetical protein
MFLLCSSMLGTSMSNRRNLSQAADEIVEFIGTNPTDTAGSGGHDVSNEPRVPKGSPKGGEWTTEGNGASNKATASRRGTTVTITLPNGTKEIRNGGSRAWRNNNPGNIEAGDRANRYGAVGSDGRFAVFPDEATGHAAHEMLLKDRYSDKTIDQAVAAWAPEKDGNNTAAYQAFVQNVSGLKGDRKVGDLTAEERQRLMGAQRRMEGWKPGTVTQR